MTSLSLAASPLTREQAGLELQGLDLEFLLFANASSGEDEVAYRGLDDELAHQQAAPVMLAAAAIERLEASGESFVFFVDALTRRGNVLYRRVDGRYGLVKAPPATD